MPVITGCDLYTAQEPFFHADRTFLYDVMIYVISGHIYVTEEDTDYDIAPGQLLFLRRGIHHYGKKQISKGTQWYYVHFLADAQSASIDTSASSVLPTNGVLVAPVLPASGILASPVLPANGILTSPVLPAIDGVPADTRAAVVSVPKFTSCPANMRPESSMTEIIDCFHSDQVSERLKANALFHLLLTKISFCQESPSKTQQLSRSDQICLFLDSHLSEPFSAAVLEQHFFLSYKHLAAVFKKEKHLTMQQYHAQVRMNAACKMLKSTLLSVTEISEQLGYSDSLYFSRCFHRQFGMSPSAYRKAQLLLY